MYVRIILNLISPLPFYALLANNTWEQLHPTGDTLQNLQEHTAVVYQDKVYVFGGEVGFSSASESPLWSYSIKVGNTYYFTNGNIYE